MEKFLTYEQFGAKGDGFTDDFDAIIATHEEANKTGTPVKAKDGASYYIKKIASAVIKTDVDFGKAEFIINDVGVPLDQRSTPLFVVRSDYEKVSLDISSFKRDQGKLDFPHEGNAYVRLINANSPKFIRKGLNMNSGKPTTDSFIVDADGNVKNLVNYDYDEITEAYYRCADDKPITIKGGKFVTIANQAESFYHYHGRGFSITRSNVTIDGIKHFVYGEGEHGAPYGGFFAVTESYNVTLENCLLTPHFIYKTESKVPGQLVNMGSYDINFSTSLNCTIKGIRQTVDIFDNRYWGLIHTNFCKDLTIEDCIMSRYDAHEGVTNVTIRNSTFGHQRVNLIGYGEALIENCTMKGWFFHLRPDYGAFWNGNITLRNCTLNAVNGTGNTVLFAATNNSEHDFGYVCQMPTVLTLDGITVNDEALDPEKKIFLLPFYDNDFDNPHKPFPYVPTKKVIVKNFKTTSGRPYTVAPFMEHYKDLEVIEE